MSKNQLYVPNKLNVGYQNRKDTYTGKLAYIIYWDEKNKLRKEASWRTWRDSSIEPNVFDNVPTEGFVINKNVGGTNYNWHSRQAKIRVYDPRDFEFEITLENLLYILANSSGMSYKGLEGEFIYGWDGKEMILIPCSSPDYKQIKEYNDLLRSDFKLTAKTIKIGTTYMTDKEETVVYLGRYNQFEHSYYLFKVDDTNRFELESKDKGKKYWFYNINTKSIEAITLPKIKKLIDEETNSMISEYQNALLSSNKVYAYKTVYKKIENDDDLKMFLEKIYKNLNDNTSQLSIYLFNNEFEIKKQFRYKADYSYAYNQKKSNTNKYLSMFTNLILKKEKQSIYNSRKYSHTFSDKNELKSLLNKVEFDEDFNGYNLYSQSKKINFTFEEFYENIKNSDLWNEFNGMYYQELEYVNDMLDNEKKLVFNYSIY